MAIRIADDLLVLMTQSLNPSDVLAVLTKLAEVWPQYRELGHIIAQRAARDPELERGLLVDSRIDPGDLLNCFTGVREILSISNDEVEFVDLSGRIFFATIDFSRAPPKVASMKIECPCCFGEKDEPPCPICEGAGRT